MTTVSATAIVQVNPASSQKAFYVDPTYKGGTELGSESAPWKSLLDTDSDYPSKWNSIRSALLANDVIVYFSARQADSDISEQLVPPKGAALVVNRGCRASTARCTSGPDITGAHRLTLDGMSMYNRDDATPHWEEYAGTTKFKVNCVNTCGGMSLGWGDDNQRDYITIRGFEVTGPGSRIRWGGSYSYLEYMWVHDVTAIGATVQFNQAVGENGHGCPVFDRDHDITIRNNVIERGVGEGIYFAGNYLQVKYGGCPSYGNTHSDILVEGNSITDTAINGGEGDGLDLKAGLMNVTVRKNVVSKTHGGGTCIVSEGVFPPAETNYLIDGNRCTDVTGWSVVALIAQNKTVIRNNVLTGALNKPGVYITVQTDGVYPNHQVSIYNNTLYNTAGIGIDHATDVVLRNNLLLGNSSAINGRALTNYNSDYNLFAPAGSRLREGDHSIVHASANDVVINAARADFHLRSASPAKDRGLDLSIPANLSAGSTTFNSDIDRVLRPQGSSWDIGAYAFPGHGSR
ncbi:MAG TPA: right-handed parallel beta-helix repeat-containing protein [Vicinamibacterales bacterium]|nr:right-handed parallel beta-helix repeat-containing protein [Vicinamibacterales bacterium]